MVRMDLHVLPDTTVLTGHPPTALVQAAITAPMLLRPTMLVLPATTVPMVPRPTTPVPAVTTAPTLPRPTTPVPPATTVLTYRRPLRNVAPEHIRLPLALLRAQHVPEARTVLPRA